MIKISFIFFIIIIVLTNALFHNHDVMELSTNDLELFDRDGFILIRGLLRGKELKEAIKAATDVSNEPWQFINAPYRKIDFNNLHSSKILHKIATRSKVADVVRQLMGNNPNDDIRILKDAILAFEPKKSGCGWHVDDRFFWPSPLKAKRSDAHPGINVWIALSPIRKKFGGGLAIAPTSHQANWMTTARSIIFDNKQTCSMATLSPEHHNYCEQLRTTFDMEPGDAIIHTRWMFHCSDNFTEEGIEHYHNNGKKPLMRYSVRYMPGDTPICDFTGNEPFSKQQPELKGQPMKVSEEWFPKVFGRTSSLLKKK